MATAALILPEGHQSARGNNRNQSASVTTVNLDAVVRAKAQFDPEWQLIQSGGAAAALQSFGHTMRHCTTTVPFIMSMPQAKLSVRACWAGMSTVTV